MTDLDDLVQQLDLEEKVSLLAGQVFWSLPAIPRGARATASDWPMAFRPALLAP